MKRVKIEWLENGIVVAESRHTWIWWAFFMLPLCFTIGRLDRYPKKDPHLTFIITEETT